MKSNNIPRSEYPRPQFFRKNWLCLNGEWDFEIDSGNSGLKRDLLHKPFSKKITVPFCPESKLSGIENIDFLNAVWYRKRVTIPGDWNGMNVLLHFQAVDYDTTVWVNGCEVRRHRGGFASFTCELKHAPNATSGNEIEIVVRAQDDHRTPKPRGKQSERFENYGCLYTRTTGIWQTVWLEPVPEHALRRPRITPDIANSCFHIEQPISKISSGFKIRAKLRDKNGIISESIAPADQDFTPSIVLVIPQNRKQLWSTHNPHLYSIDIELLDSNNQVVDSAQSYAGLRSVTIQGKKVLINGESVFQRLVLDQGYYIDGILTAPSDEDLKNDILLSVKAGFNGARLHQKVFEERFLYHCDQLGYLVWGEFGDWGAGGQGPTNDHQKPGTNFVSEWLEIIERDYSHPSIIGWCPLNETHQVLDDHFTQLDDTTRAMFLATKAMDTTRPVLDASGYSHRVLETDIYDCHNYEQKPDSLAQQMTGLSSGKPFINTGAAGETWSLPYRGQPYFVSEFGGILWNPNASKGEDSWGYGEGPKTLDEFYERFEKLCGVLLDDPNMFGYCYTQLTDVFQEQNGIYRFDRSEKFNMDRIRNAQIKKAAIEK